MTNLNNTSDNDSLPTKLGTYYLFILIALIGLVDSVFLTSQYLAGSIHCSIISGCQDVLNSQYSHIGPMPTSVFGVGYYLTIILVSLIFIKYKNILAKKYLQIVPALAFVFSLWLTYLQIFVIGALCQYCLLSALTSTILFVLSLFLLKKSARGGVNK